MRPVARPHETWTALIRSVIHVAAQEVGAGSAAASDSRFETDRKP